jgi:peptide deformylase
MTIREILHHPDERLRKKAESVTVYDGELETLVADMFETMYAAPGIGLAATQIDKHLRVIVVDCGGQDSHPLHFINPELICLEGTEEMEEGCLSVPGVFETVSRAETIKVRAFDKSGIRFEMEADGLLAVCIQHEIEHLEGKLFVDMLSNFKQKRIIKKLSKLNT